MSPVSQRWIDLGSQAAMPYCVAKGKFLRSNMSLNKEIYRYFKTNDYIISLSKVSQNMIYFSECPAWFYISKIAPYGFQED